MQRGECGRQPAVGRRAAGERRRRRRRRRPAARASASAAGGTASSARASGPAAHGATSPAASRWRSSSALCISARSSAATSVARSMRAGSSSPASAAACWARRLAGASAGTPPSSSMRLPSAAAVARAAFCWTGSSPRSAPAARTPTGSPPATIGTHSATTASPASASSRCSSPEAQCPPDRPAGDRDAVEDVRRARCCEAAQPSCALEVGGRAEPARRRQRRDGRLARRGQVRRLRQPGAHRADVHPADAYRRARPVQRNAGGRRLQALGRSGASIRPSTAGLPGPGTALKSSSIRVMGCDSPRPAGLLPRSTDVVGRSGAGGAGA